MKTMHLPAVEAAIVQEDREVGGEEIQMED